MSAPEDSHETIDWDALVESTDYHDVAVYNRGWERRTYRLRVLGKGAELWRISDAEGEPPESVKETRFNTAEEAGRFLEEMARALRAGGWTKD